MATEIQNLREQIKLLESQLEISQAFGKVSVSERNFAWFQIDNLKLDIQALKEQVENEAKWATHYKLERDTENKLHEESKRREETWKTVIKGYIPNYLFEKLISQLQ